MKRLLSVACMVALCVLGVTIPAQASHIQGVKATVTNLDVGTLTADMDVTMYTNGTATTGDTTNIGTAGNPYVSAAPGIDWGDGATLSSGTLTGIASAGPAIYRGSFSHSYASAGPFNVTVASTCCATQAGTGTITGNRVGPSTGTFAIFTNTATIDFAAVPAASWRMLAALAVLMVLAGIYLLKR